MPTWFIFSVVLKLNLAQFLEIDVVVTHYPTGHHLLNYLRLTGHRKSDERWRLWSGIYNNYYNYLLMIIDSLMAKDIIESHEHTCSFDLLTVELEKWSFWLMYFCTLLQPLRIVELSAFLEQQRMDPESVGKLYLSWNSTHLSFVFIFHFQRKEIKEWQGDTMSKRAIRNSDESNAFNIEWFSNDCQKPNTKVITATNHNRSKQHNEPIKIACNLLKCRKNCVVQLVLDLLLVGWNTQTQHV